MSTDVRASVSTAAVAPQTARGDSGFQNQLFEIGGDTDFNRVMEQQASARREAQQARQQERERDREAADRLDSGKRLPDRHEQRATRNEQAAEQASRREIAARDKARERVNRVEADEAADARAEQAAVQAQAAQNQSVQNQAAQDQKAQCANDPQQDSQSQDASASNALPSEAQDATTAGQVAQDQTTQTLQDAAATAAAITSDAKATSDSATSILQEVSDAAGVPAVAGASLPADASQSAMVAAQATMLALVAGQADAQAAMAAAGQGTADVDGAQNASELALREGMASGAATDAMAAEAAMAEAALSAGSLDSESDAASASGTAGSPVQNGAGLAAEAAVTLAAQNPLQAAADGAVPVTQSTQPGPQPAAKRTDIRMLPGESSPASIAADTAGVDADALEKWQASEQIPAEKSVEARADAGKSMPLNPERMPAFKEQLAALAQQMEAGGKAATGVAAESKTDTASDVKGVAFTRTLEQLSGARGESAKPLSTGIQTPLTSKEWAGEMGQRLVMMVSSKIKSAEIHLNPKDLGPVEVRIRMHEDKAHVVFTSQVAQTREALEQAMPRLREMLDQNGVTLGNANVQDHGAQHSHQRQQHDSHGSGGQRDALAVDDTGPVNIVKRDIGLVDFYA